MFMEISNMKLTVIHTGNFKLDGGAMFGVVPKTIWNKLNPADEFNLCNWAMRCLLIETDNRKILIDTGIGNKQSEKFYSHYYLNGDFGLKSSLNQQNISPEEITDVILTHLHFDHCGGAIEVDQITGDYKLAFPNASFYLTEKHWNHANNPNPREKASFLPENFQLLKSSGRLNFLNEGDMLFDVIEVLVFDGHTLGMICPLIHLPKGKKLLYGADLFPSSAHIPVNYVMGYDIQPLKTMEERTRINERAFNDNWYYFYEHDLNYEISKVSKNEKGQFSSLEAGKLSSII